MNFIKLCDLYYDLTETSILLEDGEVLFLNEEQVVVHNDRGLLSHDTDLQYSLLCELEKAGFVDIVVRSKLFVVVELNFSKRSAIYKGYLKNFFDKSKSLYEKAGMCFIGDIQVTFKVERNLNTLILRSHDKIQHREIDMPRKVYFLLIKSDDSYHFEQALSAWVSLQILDFQNLHLNQNFDSAELLGSIMQDIGLLDVFVSQDLDADEHSIDEKLNIDINKENQLILRYQKSIRTIQLPHDLSLIEQEADIFKVLHILVKTLFDDLLQKPSLKV